MKPVKLSLLLLLLLSLSLRLSPQEQNDDIVFVRKIANIIRNSNSLLYNFHFLTKDIGARLSGSPAMYNSEQWVKYQMKKAGADSVWLQPCKVSHWERGGQDSVFLSFTDNDGKTIRRKTNTAALGRSIGSGEKGLRAGIIRIDSFEELDKPGIDVSGKIVFFNPRFRENENPIDEYSKLAKYRTNGAAFAAKHGAKGVIVRSLTNSIDTSPHTGVQYYEPDLPQIPAAAISTIDADFLDQLCNDGKQVEAEIYTHGRILPDTIGHNVIGEIRGSEYPSGYITIGAHLDSWDIGEGASDDGTGVVITLETLRVLKESGYRPKHTLRFVLFADEENGLKGANAYAEMAKERNEQHVFAIESDSGCFPPLSIGLVGLASESVQRLDSLTDLFKPYGGVTFINRGAADISPLNQAFKTPLAALWSDQLQYFRVHHSTNDTFENADVNSIKLGAIDTIIMLYLAEKYLLY